MAQVTFYEADFLMLSKIVSLLEVAERMRFFTTTGHPSSEAFTALYEIVLTHASELTAEQLKRFGEQNS